MEEINKNSDPLITNLIHWRLDDKKFQEERKAKWPMIESILESRSKSKSSINQIKKYYLKGELPDWVKIAKGKMHPDEDIGLDIATFLWLHPSSDLQILKPLRDAYYSGFGRSYYEVINGMSFVYQWGVGSASRGYGLGESTLISFGGKGKLLFDLIFADLQESVFEVPPAKYLSNWPGDYCLQYFGEWLRKPKMNKYAKEVLLQYDEPIDLMFNSINDPSGFFASDFQRMEKVFAKALYRIAFFDIEKEGASPRTSSVEKIRTILDDGNNLPELTNLWKQVKNGQIIVKDPWKA